MCLEVRGIIIPGEEERYLCLTLRRKEMGLKHNIGWKIG